MTPVMTPAPKGGPQTSEGKAITARSSTTHGLSGAQIVLSYESNEQFDELVKKYRADFQPETEHEFFAIRQMADARWKLNRLSRIEAAAFEELLSPGQPSTPDHAIALGLLGKEGDIFAKAKLQRYRDSLERSYYRAHKEFQASRKQRHADPDAELCRALDAYIDAPVPLTRGVVVRYKTNSPAPAPSASSAKLQNELPAARNSGDKGASGPARQSTSGGRMS